MSFLAWFANGERLHGADLEDARRCVAAVRASDRVTAMLPAQIWEMPEPVSTPTGFRISRGGLVEEHVRSGVIEVRPPPDVEGPEPAGLRIGHRFWIGSCGADGAWTVAATLEEWVTFAGRDDYAWVALSSPVAVPISPDTPWRPVRRALVAARHPGWDLRRRGAGVHIRLCRPANGDDRGSEFEPGDIIREIWGIACETPDEAAARRC